MDYVLNGKAVGDVAARLMAADFDVNALRPYIGTDGRSYITTNVAGSPKAVPLVNAAATLRHEEWKQLDTVVMDIAQARLRFVADLRSRNLTYAIPNGLGTTVLMSENMSDISDAQISMDGLKESSSDRSQVELVNLPLPIISKDFTINARQLATSRRMGTPLDMTMVEKSTRKVVEMVEKLHLGKLDDYSFGGGKVQGMTNYDGRLLKSLTAPTTSGWTPAVTVQEVLAMKAQAQAAHYYGPYMIYVSPAWDQYLDDDYSAEKGDNTLRQRISMIEGIGGIVTLDFLTDWDLVLLQMTSDVVRTVNAMDVTTIQWESHGGLLLHFKVMCILVPQFRCDQDGNTGIVHGG